MNTTAQKRVLRRRPRGSAAVELAIMCVVLVPLMMYVSFLQDALLFKLDGQEAAVSAPYDFVTQAYDEAFDKDKNVDADQVGRMNRLTHCDHSSAYNTYSDPTYDCGAKGAAEDSSAAHHYGEWSVHQCWLVNGASQVHCKWDDQGGIAMMPPAIGVIDWAQRWNKGGVVTCGAAIGIMNYYLPNKFFDFWSKQDVSGGEDPEGRLKKFTNEAGIHGDAKNVANSKNAMVLPKDSLAMLHDPWALNHIDDIDPDVGEVPTSIPGTTVLIPGMSPPPGPLLKKWHPLLDRSGHYYVMQANKEKSAHDFRSNADKFVTMAAEVDGLGDSPFSLPILYKAEQERSDGDGNYASGWQDSRQSDMAQNRGTYYFGLQDANGDGT